MKTDINPNYDIGIAAKISFHLVSFVGDAKIPAHYSKSYDSPYAY